MTLDEEIKEAIKLETTWALVNDNYISSLTKKIKTLIERREKEVAIGFAKWCYKNGSFTGYYSRFKEVWKHTIDENLYQAYLDQLPNVD